jgi:hypothetical protein
MEKLQIYFVKREIYYLLLLIYIIYCDRTILRLSSAMSGGVLDIIIHEFHCCIRHFFITLLPSIM